MKSVLPSEKAAALVLTGVAFALRLMYLLYSHPFIDEFTTVLAARAVLEKGLPILSSGLFYEHGLLFTYLDAPFAALAGEQVLFPVVRWPSLLIGTLTVPLVYQIGRRWLSPLAGLVAAALLAVSPEGMVWGGRARMYALVQLLVLVLAFLVYEGSRGEGEARLRISARTARWLGLVVLLAALLAQLGAVILVPPLLIAGLVVGWLSRGKNAPPWFWSRTALTQGVAVAGAIGLGLLVKRLGRPVGAAPLDGASPTALLGELFDTVTYQAGLALDGGSALDFLAREFGVPHHLWLTLIAAVGGLVALLAWLRSRQAADQPKAPPSPLFYLWLVFGLAVVEVVTLLEPWRRNPRYLVMALPLFYLIVAGSLVHISELARAARRIGRLQVSIVAFAIVQAMLLIPDLRIAYRTPEPAYEQAFEYVAEHWQPGDALLTMNTSATGLYLPVRGDSGLGLYAFAVQEDAEQFLLNAEGQLVDRWLGLPWVGTAADFRQVLDENPRAWFVVDNIRLPVYYRGDWLAALESQMSLVWSNDNALVYLARPDRPHIPPEPTVRMGARFGEVFSLDGYTLARKGDGSSQAQLEPCSTGKGVCVQAGDTLLLTLFWQILAPAGADYTLFVHVRNALGDTVAQVDGQPYEGRYPTSQWRTGEALAQQIEVALPLGLAAGPYSIYVGLYRLDTMARLPLAGDTSGENALMLDDGIWVVSGE